MRPLIFAVCLIALVLCIPADAEAACRGPVRGAVSVAARVVRGVASVRPVRRALRGAARLVAPARARGC